MSLEPQTSLDFGKGFSLFAIAFALFAAVIVLLVEGGMPGSAASILLASGTLISFIVIGIFARTMHLPDFQVASHAVPPVLNGMATAAALLSSAGFLGLAGLFFGGNNAALAVVAGWMIGFLALSVLIAPYFRRTGAATIAEFLAIRFGSAGARLAALVVTLAASAGFLVAELAAAGEITDRLLGIGADTGIGIAVIVIICGSMLGGMRAVTTTAIAQYIVLAIAFLTPVILLSLQIVGGPDTSSFDLSVSAETAAKVTNRFLPIPPLDSFNMVALALSLATGIACLPHIVMRSASSVGVGAARRAAGWALFFVLPFIALAPIYAAFAHAALRPDSSGDPVDAATIVLSLPIIAELSPAVSALAAAGALAAILASATALLFTIASAVGHDLYSGLLDRNGPSGRRLVVTRVVIVAVACVAAWYASSVDDTIFALAATSASLAASGLFAPLLLGIWWKRATATGAFFGTVLGFASGAAYAYMTLYGGMAPWQPLGSTGMGLPPMAAAIIGVPVGLLATVLISQITPPPAPDRIEIVEALRRPEPSRLFDK